MTTLQEEGLPELPETQWHPWGAPVWHAEQMRSYGLACAEWALERAAKECEDRAKTWDGDPPDGQECEWGWMHDEAQNCASAIRSLKKEGE